MPFLVPIVASVFVSLGVGAVTAGILGGIVIYGGLALISTALRPSGGGGQQAVQEQEPFGIKTQLQSGGVVPRSIGFGKFCTAGSECYPVRTWGNSGKTPNAYLTRFIALSDLPMDSLTAIIVADKRCTYGSGAPDANLGYAIPEFNYGGADHLWVKFYDGTQSSADAWAVSQFGSDVDYPYGSDQVGRGVAYVLVTALIHEELFSSIPQYKFEGLGAKLYDPRLDTTVGGSGSHRWGQPSTYAHTYNPAVIKYNVLRGVYFYDTTVSPVAGKWLFGLQGTAAARLPLDSWFAAMNEDDQSVETAPSVFAAQFQCGGQVDVDKPPVEFIDEMNKCDAGRVAEAGGIFKTRSGAAGSAVMSFTDADFITTQPQSFEMFPGLDQTINAVTASYPDPLQNWELTDAPSLFDATLETADGGRRLIAALQLNYVFRQPQVQRLMRATREESRQFRTHHVIAPPIAFQLEPLDVIAWTSTANGYSSKLFQAIPTDQSDLDQGLVLVEVDPADYDWTPGTDYTTYIPVSVVNRAPPSQNMSGWTVSAVTITGAGGRQLPAIKLQWDVTGIDDVDGILYEVVDPSTSPPTFVVSGESERFSSGYIYISENIQAATNYQVRGKYRPTGRNRVTNWSSYLSVTTGAKQIIGSDLADAILTYAKFAASIEPVQVVSSLGAATAHEGATAFNTTDGQLYRFHSSAWTVTVPAVNVTGTLVNSQIGTAAIQATQLAANAVTTPAIAANAVVASKIFIGSTDNLVLDGQCQDVNYWSAPGGSLVSGASASTSWGSINTLSRGVSHSVEVQIFSSVFAVTPGYTYQFSGKYGADNVGGGSLGLAGQWLDNTGTFISLFTFGVLSASGGPNDAYTNQIAPSNAAKSFIYAFQTGSGSNSGSLYFSRPIVRLMGQGSLIVDGSITAAEIAAGTITANEIAANTITANEINANAITSSELAANSVVAGKVAAGAINVDTIIANNVVITGHLVVNTASDYEVVSYGYQGPIAATAGAGSWVAIGSAITLEQVHTYAPVVIRFYGDGYVSGATGTASLNVALFVDGTIYSGSYNATGVSWDTDSVLSMDIASGSRTLQLYARMIDDANPGNTPAGPGVGHVQAAIITMSWLR